MDNTISDELIRRILPPQLHNKVMSAEQAAKLIQSGNTIGCSGFASVGYPKQVLKEVAKQKLARNLSVISGASCGDEVNGELSRAGALDYLSPFNNNDDARTDINNGKIKYLDMHLSKVPSAVRNGVLPKIDVAVIECCCIDYDCGLVPTLSIGASDAFVACADAVIVELNLAYPTTLKGIHDIRGRISVPCTEKKIAAIVITDCFDKFPVFTYANSMSNCIAHSIVSLLKAEIKAKRISRHPTLQSGIGTVANAVLDEMKRLNFNDFEMYTEVVQDAALQLLIQGNVTNISTAALLLSEEGLNAFIHSLDKIKDKIKICTQDATNGAGMVESHEIVAMNTAVEIDIYGNVNSTHLLGSKIINGIGGSGDFTRHARLAVFMTPSMAKNDQISCIVPMVSHVDHTEHDVQIIVTEQGIADLRGKCPRDRAACIIENCCHPDYRDALREYFMHAQKAAPALHTPHDLERAFAWHTRYLKTGTMKR